MRVCIISEGSYPIVRGGLSEWAQLLMKTLPDVEFSVFCITIKGKETPLYTRPPNVKRWVIVPLIGSFPKEKTYLPKKVADTLSTSLRNSLLGNPMDLERIVRLQGEYSIDKGWLLSKSYWDFMVDFYRKTYPGGSFVEFYWTILGLYSVLLDSISMMRQIPRADVYHCLSSGYAGMAGAMAKLMYGSPVIVTEQGLYIAERQKELSRQNLSEWYRNQLCRFTESIVKTSYRYADKVVPPCYSHVAVERELGIDMEKVQVINNGIDCKTFVPASLKNGAAPVVGCFARVVPIKGIEVLIRAAKVVLERHAANFVVVGEIQDKEYYRECQKLVAELGLDDHFKFIGHTDSLTWYHKVDIFTLSSISEGVPYALLEAMSCGLPSVCTAVGGVPEIITDGVGYLVPPEQPEVLAERLSELIANKGLRARMGQRATEMAREKYTIEEMAGKFYELYKGAATWVPKDSN